VRILLLSDIHANLEALDACLAAAPSFDSIVNLGDIVGYGASPNEVADRSRELGKLFVRGNHDKAATGLMELDDFNPMAAAAAIWTRNALTPQNLEWLRGLPHGPVSVPEFPDIQLVHGSPNDEDEYVVSLGDALAPLITITMPLTFFGHTHLQGGFFANGSSADGFRPEYRTVGQAESVSLHLKNNARYLINPGSVGQPRDGDWRAAFALYDSEAQVVHFHRTPYNLKAAQDRIFEANLPADFPPDRPAALVGDPGGDGARGDAPRLQKNQRPVVRERGWDPGCLTGARLSGDDQRPRSPNAVDDLGDERIDGKRVEHVRLKPDATGSRRRHQPGSSRRCRQDRSSPSDSWRDTADDSPQRNRTHPPLRSRW